MKITVNRTSSPWWWIPSVYIAEGLPYFAVNTLTVLMYTKLGVGLKEMSYFTGWLYLPWVIKPFWSPFVDIIGSKRGWTIAMQIGLALSMAAVAMFLPTSFFFSATLAVFWIMAFFSATHDIAADGYYMLELTPHQQAAYVGVRSTFYRIASVIGQGGLVIMAGLLETSTKSIPLAWQIVFLSLSVFFALVSVWDWLFMPKSATDRPAINNSVLSIITNFGQTFVTFVKKPHIVSAICFMLLYRLPEAFCIKLVQPFLVTAKAEGGLGLTTTEVGFVNGTTGVLALLAGGILGGLAIARNGLKSWLWPMAASLTLPCALYCVLAMTQPDSFIWINIAVGIEQFGYGFGFTAFMLYLIYFSQGKSATSHYAFCTGFMALGMMLPGMAAGWVAEKMADLHIFASSGPQQFINFFWWVMFCCIATFAVCAFLKIDPQFGRKQS